MSPVQALTNDEMSQEKISEKASSDNITHWKDVEAGDPTVVDESTHDLYASEFEGEIVSMVAVVSC